MKILYGVQGTGNGHITRARAMAEALKNHQISVDFLFSGRESDAYFDMACFGDYRTRQGLTFAIVDGQIKYFKTMLKNNLWQFFKDIRQLDLQGYDCVLCDFEPITAWAARRQKVPILGIGHQYVFDFPIPQQQPSWMTQQVFKHFAPVKKSLPLHWHHFDQPILPPIVEQSHQTVTREEKLVLVYLPFENQLSMIELLKPFKDHTFVIYTPETIYPGCDHIRVKPLSRNGFQTDLHRCDAIIANAGFELSSEALCLGKKILVKPLHRQSEQISNGIALKTLNYGHVTDQFDSASIHDFLNSELRVQVSYPDVSDYIVQWIKSGLMCRNANWYQNLWQQVHVEQLN